MDRVDPLPSNFSGANRLIPGAGSTAATEPVKVLVVGQTPPPLGGQAIMIERMLAASYRHARLFHVRMGFSQDMGSMGRFRFAKLIELIRVVLAIWLARFRTGARVLYYPPAGPDMVPLLRDLAILSLTRPLFARTILHFHAGGVSTLYLHLNRPLRLLFRLAYFRADAAIRQSRATPEDARDLRAKVEHILPCGIPDEAVGRVDRPRPDKQVPELLFMGVLREDKGVLVLLEAARILAERGHRFTLTAAGAFGSPEFEAQCQRFLVEHGLTEKVRFPGIVSGESRYELFDRADIFCFPSFFHSETLGLVVAEAMSFSLPVVATRWRGIPELVLDGETGLLVPVRDAAATADAIARLLCAPDLGRALGARGRARFLEGFTDTLFVQKLDQIFAGLA